jgi:hypothetical protein
LQILDRPTVRILTDNYDIKEISDFVDMDDEERKKILKGKDIDRIAAACNRFPTISVKSEIGEKNEEEI